MNICEQSKPSLRGCYWTFFGLERKCVKKWYFQLWESSDIFENFHTGEFCESNYPKTQHSDLARLKIWSLNLLSWQLNCISTFDSTVTHFTVPCLVIRPLSRREARVDFVMIQTLLLSNVNYPVIMLIVPITKFLMLIGFSRAYLSCNQRAITWVSNYRYPIWTFCNWMPIIGYPRDSHVNCAGFNVFLRTVSCSFQNFWKALQTFLLKRTSRMTF